MQFLGMSSPNQRRSMPFTQAHRSPITIERFHEVARHSFFLAQLNLSKDESRTRSEQRENGFEGYIPLESESIPYFVATKGIKGRVWFDYPSYTSRKHTQDPENPYIVFCAVHSHPNVSCLAPSKEDLELLDTHSKFNGRKAKQIEMEVFIPPMSRVPRMSPIHAIYTIGKKGMQILIYQDNPKFPSHGYPTTIKALSDALDNAENSGAAIYTLRRFGYSAATLEASGEGIVHPNQWARLKNEWGMFNRLIRL